MQSSSSQFKVQISYEILSSIQEIIDLHLFPTLLPSIAENYSYHFKCDLLPSNPLQPFWILSVFTRTHFVHFQYADIYHLSNNYELYRISIHRIVENGVILNSKLLRISPPILSIRTLPNEFNIYLV